MFSSHCCTIRRTLSQQIFQQLCQLWREFWQQDEENIILLDQTVLKEHLRELDGDFGEAITPEKKHLLLLVNREFRLLLDGLPINQGLFYHVTILVNMETIDQLIEDLLNSATVSKELKEKIKEIIGNSASEKSSGQNKFLLQLVNFLELASSGGLNQNNSEEIIALQKQQNRQKDILEEVVEQIKNNLDELTIIEKTLTKVQKLLDVDRLLIYQVQVEISCDIKEINSGQKADLVTYEVLRNEEISSILYFQDETCFSETHPCRQKYLEGFNCVINDIEKEKNMAPCLKELMKKLKIRAKMVVPILVENNLWGFIIAHHCFEPRNWQIAEVNYLTQIAEYLSLAIRQSQSYQKLAQEKQKLEQKINLNHQDLQYALVTAEIANQSKKQFLGAISHELLTPLTCVIGLSGTLIHWSKNKNHAHLIQEKQQEYLQKIHDNGQKLMNLINDLLDFSQIEAGKSLLNLKYFSLQHLCNFLIHQLQTTAKNHNLYLKLDFQVSPNLDQFYGDENRLQQILFHLLDNGIKFTPAEGKVILRVWRENQYVIFQVEDTGIGISENQLPLLFNKFQQLEQTRTRTHSGTGLGLAFVKQLVELHRGIIEVESIVGEGTIFTVRIPQNLSGNKINQELLSPGFLEEDHGFPLSQKRTIVIISDDEENTTLICELLTSANYQVIWLMDGSTILDSITLLEPAVIIIDESITDFHDLIFDLKYIKSHQKYQFMLIAITNSILTKKALAKYPFNQCFAKPISPTEFIENIKILMPNKN